MNKKIIYILMFVGLIGLAGFASAVELENPLGATNTFGELLTKIADGVGLLIGSLGVIMLIIAGILFLTSAGNPERMGTAKKALTYAIIGMVIGIAAPAIVDVVKEILGATSTP